METSYSPYSTDLFFKCNLGLNASILQDFGLEMKYQYHGQCAISIFQILEAQF